MNLETYIERIEQFERGDMPAAERQAFEQELSTNTALQQALAVYRQADAAIEVSIENNLRSQLQEWAAVDTQKSGGRIVSMSNTWIPWAVAAGLALLVAWLGVSWAGNQYSNQALYAAHYEKPAESVFRSGQGDTNPLEPGLKAMQDGDVQVALAFFSTIPAENDRYAEAQYLRGHIALELKQYDIALLAFQNAAAQKQPKFQDKAEWNQVLCYLASEKTDDATFQGLLKTLADSPQHSFQQQAQVLQNELQSVWRRFAQ